MARYQVEYHYIALIRVRHPCPLIRYFGRITVSARRRGGLDGLFAALALIRFYGF